MVGDRGLGAVFGERELADPRRPVVLQACQQAGRGETDAEAVLLGTQRTTRAAVVMRSSPSACKSSSIRAGYSVRSVQRAARQRRMAATTSSASSE